MTMTELSKERLKELYLPTTDDFVFVDVPELQFAMVNGEGDPDDMPFRHAVKWLFSAIYPIKRIAKERMGKDFVEPPLEGLWWADDPNDLVAGRRDRLNWRLMVVTADWVSEEMFEEAVATASGRLGEVPGTLRLERYDEGRCVQIMYIGDYRTDAASIARRLHHEFLPQHDLRPNGHHHEIYLSDPSRVAPDKMRTVVRQPVA
ncbi:MAG TPA: GyrI-like domain-containing protein [Actinomycetota bacterium]